MSKEETPSRTRDPDAGSGQRLTTANPTPGPITRYGRGTQASSKMSHDENRRKVSKT